MDPLSITTSVLALANAVFKPTVFIRDTVGGYSDAPKTMSDVADEVKTMEVALRVVKRVIRAEPHAIARFDLEDVFSLAVKGCHATLMCIRKEYEQLFGREDWRTKIIVLWKDREMSDLLARLDRKKSTIGILVQTLNLHSTQEIRACLNDNRQTLHVAKRDLCDLLPAYPSCKDSIIGSLDGGTVDSILGDQDSVLSTTEFAFDYEFINTKAYRGALARLQINSRTGSPSSRPSQITTSVSCPEIFDNTVSRVSATEPKNRFGSSYDALPSQALLSATPNMRPRKQPCPQDPIADRFASLALEHQGPPRNRRSPGDTRDCQAPAPSTDATQRSPQSAQHSYETDASRVDKTVACLLIETKRLLETLTQWSHGQATEDQVSQVCVKQGDNFIAARRAFRTINIDTSDLGNVSNLLRPLLEDTLSHEPSPDSLQIHTSSIQVIIGDMLQGFKRKQRLTRRIHQDRRARPGNSAASNTLPTPTYFQYDECRYRKCCLGGDMGGNGRYSAVMRT